MNPLSRAIAIAAEVHVNDTDKGGSAYILHPLRMMAKMTTDEERMAAILHDVVEDHHDDGWSFDRLEAEGIPISVIEALRCVTKISDDEDYISFIHRVAANPLARTVKLADLEDNMNMLRISDLTEWDLARLKKYHIAYQWLQKQTDDVSSDARNQPT